MNTTITIFTREVLKLQRWGGRLNVGVPHGGCWRSIRGHSLPYGTRGKEDLKRNIKDVGEMGRLRKTNKYAEEGKTGSVAPGRPRSAPGYNIASPQS